MDTVGKKKIRTTINPGEVLTVDEAEYIDLKRQGLIYEEPKSATDKKGE